MDLQLNVWRFYFYLKETQRSHAKGDGGKSKAVSTAPNNSYHLLLGLYHVLNTVLGTSYTLFLIFQTSLHGTCSFCVLDEESEARRCKNNRFKIIFLERVELDLKPGLPDSRLAQHSMMAESRGRPKFWPFNELRVTSGSDLASPSFNFRICKREELLIPTLKSRFWGLDNTAGKALSRMLGLR